MIPTLACIFLAGVLVGFLLPKSTSEGSERSYAMIPIFALILLLAALAAVLPGLLARDDAEELGYTLHEPRDDDVVLVEIVGRKIRLVVPATPPPADLVAVRYHCIACRRTFIGNTALVFHILMEHEGEASHAEIS